MKTRCPVNHRCAIAPNLACRNQVVVASSTSLWHDSSKNKRLAPERLFEVGNLPTVKLPTCLCFSLAGASSWAAYEFSYFSPSTAAAASSPARFEGKVEASNSSCAPCLAGDAFFPSILIGDGRFGASIRKGKVGLVYGVRSGSRRPATLAR